MRRLEVRNSIFFDPKFWEKAPDGFKPLHMPKNRAKTSTMKLPKEITLKDNHLFLDGTEIGYAISKDGIIEEIVFYGV